MKRGASVLALVLALAACGDDGLRAGHVGAMEHRPATRVLVPIISCMPVGKGSVCTTTYMPDDRPECWRVTVVDGDLEGSWCIARGDWDRLSVGDFYEVSEEVES